MRNTEVQKKARKKCQRQIDRTEQNRTEVLTLLLIVNNNVQTLFLDFDSGIVGEG
jgi:hypothetical protein